MWHFFIHSSQPRSVCDSIFDLPSPKQQRSKHNIQFLSIFHPAVFINFFCFSSNLFFFAGSWKESGGKKTAWPGTETFSKREEKLGRLP